jgi:hypothetical protein
MNTRSSFLLIFVAVISASVATGLAQAPRRMATVSDNTPVTIVPEPGRTPLATLVEGTQVQVLGPEEDGWYRIAFQDNYLLGDRIGYVRAEHVRLATTTATSPSDRGAKSPAPVATPPIARPPNGSRTSGPAATNRRPSRGNLTESSIAEAIVTGRMQRNVQGLRLLENGQTWTASTGAGAMTSRFRLQLHTPLTWIKQLAGDAANQSRAFRLEDVTDEMTEPVLRITAYSAPMSPSSGSRACWVRHVVLRGATKDSIVQPLSKVAFSEHVVSGAGGSTVFEGLRLTFPIDAVRRLRGPRGDGDFLIGVIGLNGEEKDLKITKEYLQELPM